MRPRYFVLGKCNSTKSWILTNQPTKCAPIMIINRPQVQTSSNTSNNNIILCIQ